LTVRDQAFLFFDEKLFRDHVEVAQAGGDTGKLIGIDNAESGWDMLGPGSVVRVLKPTPGGARVVVDRWMKAPYLKSALGPVVENKDGAGKIGWIDEAAMSAMSR
jgi:hypothetical protein